jgi:hypothetical protein
MFINVKKYVINTDQVIYVEPKESEVVVYFSGGGSVVLDRSWLTEAAVSELGLKR